jgi:hypothetical protein
MARYEDRFPVVEAYLREAFPGASVYRIHRVGDTYQEGIRPHDKGGASLRNSPIRRRLEECPMNRRLWLFTRGVLTDAALGESP